ncbi:MAG: Iduronate-2-sulfatase, partial [Verrucomicrobiales bacterium]|nr:Iduronate-2-sulfatase [Verrucomicrobiales bacterium]
MNRQWVPCKASRHPPLFPLTGLPRPAKTARSTMPSKALRSRVCNACLDISDHSSQHGSNPKQFPAPTVTQLPPPRGRLGRNVPPIRRMPDILSTFLPILFLLAFAGVHSGHAQAPPPGRPNVLFIAVDDLNHWVGHLGRNPQAKTPNIDRLAAMGVTFTNAQCAAPVCNPSRAALLSGKRPGTSGIYDNGQPFTNALGPKTSLVTQFKNAGYQTIGMGKLWHGGLGWPEQWTRTQDEPRPRPTVDDRSIGGIRFGVLQGGDEGVPDTAIADFAIKELSEKHDQPFFLTLGFHKPHMPWFVPQKYYDLHPLEAIILPPAKAGDLDDLPPAAIKMAKAQGDHAAVLASGRWKEAVQAYLAAISYLDAQVGRVLDAYEKS